MEAPYRSLFLRPPVVLALLLIALSTSAFAQDSEQQYRQMNLVSNQAGQATYQDTDLVNGWGLARSSTGPWWNTNQGTGVATVYSGSGMTAAPPVTIPSGDPSVNPLGTPTGIVYNGSSSDFLLESGKPAQFLFATEDGTISGWNPAVLPTAAVIKVNQAGKSVFTGLAVAQVTKGGASATYLYVTDFEQGRVEVFDTNFNPVPVPWEGFRDYSIPEGLVPYNIWNIGGNLYVTYGQQAPNKRDQITGPGLGYVDVFSPSGRLLQRLEHGPWFNAPYGIALAPGDFGLFSHDVLVGQYGSGEILAFDPVTGKYKGKLLDTSNHPITIDALSALSFGNDGPAGAATALYFNAGPNGELNGLFGCLTPVQNTEGNDD